MYAIKFVYFSLGILEIFPQGPVESFWKFTGNFPSFCNPTYIRQEWNNIPLSKIQQLVPTVLKHLHPVVKREGGCYTMIKMALS